MDSINANAADADAKATVNTRNQYGKTHGESSYSSRTGTKEYTAWRKMRERCANPIYTRYAGRGIKVCERWDSYENFLADVGRAPGPEYSLDRINGDGNYEPGNVRWATRKEQGRNRFTCRIFELNGERLSIAEWADRAGIDYYTLHGRLSKGWTIERAITAPVMVTKPRRKRATS